MFRMVLIVDLKIKKWNCLFIIVRVFFFVLLIKCLVKGCCIMFDILDMMIMILNRESVDVINFMWVLESFVV